jgi:hypothetical protein
MGRGRFRKNRPIELQYARDDDCSMLGRSWYAAEYCNWFSKQDGLPEKECCYESNELEDGHGGPAFLRLLPIVSLNAKRVSKTAFRPRWHRGRPKAFASEFGPHFRSDVGPKAEVEPVPGRAAAWPVRSLVRLFSTRDIRPPSSPSRAAGPALGRPAAFARDHGPGGARMMTWSQ